MALPCSAVEHLSVTVTSSLSRGQHTKSCPENAEYANPYIHLSLAARGQASMMYSVTPFPSKKTPMADETPYVTMTRTVASSGVRHIHGDAPPGLLLTLK
jgi:hypothetical protein